jgi:23S rRNA (cytidine1920-2'-O)/16S rRNA (cytidine1409-2'-O)-methyltransferase
MPFVSRGGEKLAHALTTFALDPRGLTCADFGCNVGGFTDCLLQSGAARVYAVDTGYGALAWTLRNDPRIVVMERTNALHADPPEPVHLITIDLGWTPQRLAIPAALRWLKPGTGATGGRIITLIKPHYELAPDEKSLLKSGVLDDLDAQRIANRTAAQLPVLGVQVLGLTRSPLLGGASKKNKRGNAEWLALVVRSEPRP